MRLLPAVVVVLFAALPACTSRATLASDTSASRAPSMTTATLASDTSASSRATLASDTSASRAPSTTTAVTSALTTPRPPWLGQRLLDTDEHGFGIPVATPDELIGRAFATIDTLPPPEAEAFESAISPLTGEELERSTWNDACPVTVDELAYVTVSFWGFDGLPHTGELIVQAGSAEDIVTVFRTLFEARYPLEEMRIITRDDLDAPPTGDTNNTGSFVCRLVQGTGTFSEHAYGLAIDINPFHNPLVRSDLVLPELAGHYADRTRSDDALIRPDSVVVDAFAGIGWLWGGNWTSLKDYQHFSQTGQ